MEMEGHKDLARDPETNAIVNVNTLEYSAISFKT